ncbi:DNA cytosine methyltransferase [Streptomyces omiyaensis]|uniref:DNA cytosine methyltransferase n=1 Tax=Streptomyces omiyaensis TaxID=68247 RepID=UPI0037003FFD
MSHTLTDLFCGGGSSSGAGLVEGVAVKKMAANHWPLAVETHNLNRPDADHDCADISQVDPRRYAKTDLPWASPSCTKHSAARGMKADPENIAAERSRATMWDVQRFAEQHRFGFGFGFVENVCEVRKWPDFRAWKISLEDLGYCLHEVFLNAAFAGQLGAATPQWRDRWFCLFHPKGTRCPDIERWTSPQAVCADCGPVDARQTWKNGNIAGKYGRQYVYACPRCGVEVKPPVGAAADIIDWMIPAPRIGDRVRPLAEKTMARIRSGLEKYGTALVPVEGRDGSSRSASTGRCVPVPAGTRPGCWFRPAVPGTTPPT